ncbi:MAG: glycosyltransferase [Cyanobacteria bacterium K_DeepCast_35m_m2_023]|nr:glycosyltransferase [Cyanobacteria bacterium K_DeepCast_35m_m2_023]
MLGSAALLLGALVLATADTGWLDAAQLNPLTLRTLPRQFQVVDLWRDALPPLVVAGLIASLTLWLPRRRWSLALMELLLLGVALRYFLWRGTTLNTAHPLSLVCSVVLFGTELLYLLTSGLQLLPALRYDPELRSRQAAGLEPWVLQQRPQVDVWIPTYNEPERLVRRAILTCRNLDYPHHTVTVLDDGHRPAIARLAQELGVNYLSRPDNAHRKAGNLNHALAHTKGTFIAVFDCDFMPYPRFLERTLGFFADATVALVQTPQHYFQAEFHNRNLGLDVVMPSDLDYFFRYLQVIRDRSNAVICCGTSYVVRRSALESIGGYVTSCLIEDHQTSTKLLTRGWRIRYLNEVLSMGEVPRSFPDFLDQRLRWMQGNIQIFFRPGELPIWSRLNSEQLSFYINLAVSVFTPLWRLIYLLLPLLSLILGFTLIAAPPIEYLAYGIPFVVLLHVVPSWLSDHHQFQFWNEVYETLFCVPGARRIAQVLRHPFRIYGGIVTSKEIQSTPTPLSNLSLLWPLLMLLSVTGITVLLRYALPLIDPAVVGWRPSYDGEALMLGWNFYNALVVIVALLACIDRPNQRVSDRFPLSRIACFKVGSGQVWGNTIDLSEEGAQLKLQTDHPELQHGQLGLLQLMEPAITIEARVVRCSGHELGLRFEAPNASSLEALLALLYSGELWFHRPRRLSISDALLHWLGSLWRAEAIRQRFP